jgi:RHS repeat-associated protein
MLTATLAFGPLQDGGATPSGEARVPEGKAPLSIPTDADIFHTRIFLEPLVPIGGETSAAENAALAKALHSYAKRKERDDDHAIQEFLSAFPKSAWRAAVLTNLGLEYRQTGWFLKALATWEEAWNLSKNEKSRAGKAMADCAIGELAELNASLGRREQVEAILKEIKDRPLIGAATEKVTAAREGAWAMNHEPGTAFKCGPFALARIQASGRFNIPLDPKIIAAQSTDHGMSLDQVWELSRSLGLDYQMAKRAPGSEIVVPSVVNWKASHYGALLREENGKFLVQDPTFGPGFWISKAALDAEGSGYFLVPHGPLAKGWQQVKADEARTVWGMGLTGQHDLSGTKCIDDKARCSKGNSSGMARYNFHTQLVSLNITDTPVGYTPPRGPDMHLTLTYNQRELNVGGYTSIPNFSSKWVCNWTAYIDDVAYNSDPFTVHLPSGGSEWFYLYYGTTTGFQSGAVMTRDVDSPPPAILYYKRTLPDGSQQVFDLHSGTTGARRFYMTKLIDPAGQVVHFNYDAQTFRLTSVTDSLGQNVTISYLSDTPTTLPDYYLISRVEDFAQRAATFEYQNGQLWKIHDTIGITSEFQYETGTDFINEMITPYGTTSFSHPASSLDTDPNNIGNARVIQAVEPDGGIERLEYGHNAPGIPPTETLPPDIYILNGLYHYRNSYYWDKKAMAMYPPDENGVPQFTKAKIIHWLHLNDGYGNTVSNIKEREKQPLENAVYYFYPGQAGAYGPVFTGWHGFPSVVARRLDDGTGSPQTQFYRYEYNTLRNIKKMTDPAGRVTTYFYAPGNEIDVREIYQRNPNGVGHDPDGLNADKIASSTYNAQHKPLTSTDAAGQTTTYVYNADGQVWTMQNAKGETTTYSYGDGTSGHPAGYLTSITSPLFSGSSAVTTFDYDSSNRVHVVTSNPDGYQVTTDYDNLDRKTQVTYPDATYEQFQYTDNITGAMTLDLTGSRDRLGRWTYRHYNANRKMDSITDPANQTTTYGWCTCGALTSITDPKHQMTTFNRDLQSRVYQKVFADTTSINYLFEGQTAPNTVGATSRLKSSTDAKSQRTNYLYFADDTVQQVSYTDTAGNQLIPPTPSVSYTYDPNYNRVASMLDGIGTTIYAYNSITVPPALGAGRLASIDAPLANDTITFGYDELGRVTNRAINGTANSAAWSFDSLGRISSATNNLGAFTNTYVGVTDRLNSMTYPGGTTAAYTYFPNAQDKRLQEIKNQTSTSVLLSQFDYTYDPEGQITTWTKNNPSLTGPQRFDLGYDNADQLLTAPLKDASTNALITQYTYIYDTAANRNSELVATTTTKSKPNNVNEIMSQSGGVNRALTYDLNGSLTNDGSARTFEWDGANRLVAVNYTGTTNRSEFSYDGVSRVAKIVEKTAGNITATRKFVWCGTEKCEFRDATDAVTLRVYPQGQHNGTAAYFFTRDHLGSIREMSKSTGAVVARYEYDPYGRSTIVIGNTLPDFNFTGLYRHSQSNLDLATYRAYDPDLGRWLSRDPIGETGGINLYGYVGNNPVGRIDPRGLWYLTNPATWGVGDYQGFNGGWDNYRAIDFSEGLYAGLDGLNPFGDPFAKNGFYDPCDRTLQRSRAIGHLAWEIETTAAAGGAFRALGTALSAEAGFSFNALNSTEQFMLSRGAIPTFFWNSGIAGRAVALSMVGGAGYVVVNKTVSVADDVKTIFGQ